MLNVLAFGAVNDGSVGCSAAVTSALTQAGAWRSAVTTGGSSVPSGGAQELVFPPGVYLWDAAVAVPSYVRLRAEGAVLVEPTGLIDFFTGLAYQADVSGFRFRGGRRHLSVATNNVDGCVINIDDCHFDTPAEACIYIDATSASTLVNAARSRCIGINGTARVIKQLSGDKVTFKDAWVQGNTDYFFENQGGMLELDSLLTVPGAAGGAWVKLTTAGELQASRLRFGGELGGKTLVECHTGPDLVYPMVPRRVIIRDSQCYATGYVATFYDMPNIVEFSGCHGLQDNDGIWFDPAMPAASKTPAAGWSYWRVAPSAAPVALVGDATVIAAVVTT